MDNVNYELNILDVPKPEQDLLIDWCKALYQDRQIKTINRTTNSYGLKHLFEKETGIYVNNGAFKGAMFLAGFDVGDLFATNWHFNISKVTIKKKREEAY